MLHDVLSIPDAASWLRINQDVPTTEPTQTPVRVLDEQLLQELPSLALHGARVPHLLRHDQPEHHLRQECRDTAAF